MSPGTVRLWRARRRHQALDAVLAPSGVEYELRYVLNRRLLLRRTYASDDAAREAADAKLRELQRAGWNVHW